jgi:hypothetical protein
MNNDNKQFDLNSNNQSMKPFRGINDKPPFFSKSNLLFFIFLFCFFLFLIYPFFKK